MQPMIALLRALRPQRLQHQMMALMSLIIVVVLVLLWSVTQQRITSVALNSTREWSEAMARAAASASAEPMAAADHASMETVLREMATLPGVLRIETLDGLGQPLLSLQSDGAGRVKSVWRLSQSAAVPLGTHELESDGQVSLQTWAPVGPQGSLGRVGVTFALARDRAHIDQLRWDALTAIALTGLITMLGVQLLLTRKLHPLRRLVRFSRQIATNPGEQITPEGGSVEMEELARTLNEASRTLREQLDVARASQERLTSIVEAAPDAIIGFDADGLVTIASPAVASVFGLEPEVLTGMPVIMLLPELTPTTAERHTLEGNFQRGSGSHVARWETTALRRDGTPFPVEISLSRTASPQGIRYACVARDITERRLSDEMLHLYSRAMECTSNGIVISDISLPGRPVFYVNAAFETITGYEPGEATGRNCAFLQREDTDQPELQILREAVANHQSAKVVLRNYRKDGSLFFNELSISPVPSPHGGVRHYVGVLNDVTERERSRLAIAERSARLNAVFDLSPDGFVVFDREGQLVYTNQVFLTMTGWDDSLALQGMKLAEFDRQLASLRDPEHSYPPLSMQEADDGGFDTMDLLHLSMPRPRVLTRLVRHNAGGQGESILYFRDVTHETEVDRMKSEFLTTAAHELRTPMVSVFGFTELLLNRPVPEEKRRDVLQTIHRQAQLLINMVNELLDLARIEARQGKDLSFAPCSTRELVRLAAEGMSGQRSAMHQLVIEDSLRDVQIQGDTEKLQRALSNVLSNAFKYSPQGGQVRVGSAEGDIDGRPAIGLWVQDQGIGMSEAQLSRVFERFYRADPSGNIPGTGLGMCLVKEIVELHRGRADVHSVSGEGTRVTLWLPLLGAPAAQASVDEEAEALA